MRTGTICFESHWERWEAATNALLDHIAENDSKAASLRPQETEQRWQAF